MLLVESRPRRRAALVRALRGAGLHVVAASSIAHVQRWPSGDIVITEAERFTPMWKTLGATHVVVLADTEQEGLECCASGATLWLPRACQPNLVVDAVQAVLSGTASDTEIVLARAADAAAHGIEGPADPVAHDAAAAVGDSTRAPLVRRLELIVRRGAQRRYDMLLRRTVDLPVVVRWDRREGDRRSEASRHVARASGGDRRGRDRRQPAPYTWSVADFVVVETSVD